MAPGKGYIPGGMAFDVSLGSQQQAALSGQVGGYSQQQVAMQVQQQAAQAAATEALSRMLDAKQAELTAAIRAEQPAKPKVEVEVAPLRYKRKMEL